MESDQLIEEMQQMLNRFEAKISYLLKRNAELEVENQTFRNYIDNESVSKSAVRKLLSDEAEPKQAEDWGEFVGGRIA